MIKLPLPIDLKKAEPRTIAVILISAAFIFILYFWVLLRPQAARLTDVFGMAGKVRADLNTAESDISRISQFKGNIEAYKEKVDSYEKRLPVEQEIPNLLEELSNMARSSNIKIVGITPVTASLKEPKEEKKSQIYQEMPILISAKSGYHELGRFLSNLENADRFMKVVDIDIKSNKLTPRKHDVELAVATFILLGEK